MLEFLFCVLFFTYSSTNFITYFLILETENLHTPFNGTLIYILPSTHPPIYPLITQLLHTPPKLTFSLCISTTFWKRTCQNLPHFHNYSLWSYHHDTIPSFPMIQDVKWKSPWYINPLTSRITVSPSCSNFKILLTLIFLELISKTNTLGVDLKLIGCTIAAKQWGHFS